MYFRWLMLVLISFVVDVIGVFAVAFGIILTGNESHFPGWALWGNDREPYGDAARKAKYDAASNWFHKAYLRWHWLAIRNPANNFGYLLGFDQADAIYSYIGDPKTSDQGHPGALFVSGDNGETRAFCFYYVKRWGASSKCLRIFLGWKIHDMVSTSDRAQLVCVVNPLMRFTDERPS